MEDFCLYAGILRHERLPKSKKKNLKYLFIISVHCPTRRQVPPFLKSTFQFRILTPIIHTQYIFRFKKFLIIFSKKIAGKILGYPIKDINGGNATGFSHVQLTVDEGKRISSAKAYLNSKIIARKNLGSIDLLSHFTKVKCDSWTQFFCVVLVTQGILATGVKRAWATSTTQKN